MQARDLGNPCDSAMSQTPGLAARHPATLLLVEAAQQQVELPMIVSLPLVTRPTCRTDTLMNAQFRCHRPPPFLGVAESLHRNVELRNSSWTGSKRVKVTTSERSRLVKLGRRVGPAIRKLITIVSPRTFARWASGESSKTKPRRPGRPRKPEEIRQMIIDLAKQNRWGSKRILGELAKLRIRSVSRSTVVRILKEHGFDPAPKRGDGTWQEFVRRHIKTLWATDFFTKKVWTPGGLVEFYVLFFIHIGTRKVHVAGVTPNPNGEWMKQQARNMCMIFDEEGDRKPTYIIRDRDTKYTQEFCSILETEEIKFCRIPPLSPNLNAHAEAWVQRQGQRTLSLFCGKDLQ